jgi:hypothetical protein
VVAAAVVEVQVRVDDHVDAGKVERVLAQRNEARIHVGDLGTQLRHAGVDEHTCVGVVDDVDVHRPPLALDEQLGHEQRRDRGRRLHQIATTPVGAPVIRSRVARLTFSVAPPGARFRFGLSACRHPD